MSYSAEDVFPAIEGWRYWIARQVNGKSDVDEVIAESCFRVLVKMAQGVHIEHMRTYTRGVITHVICKQIEWRAANRASASDIGKWLRRPDDSQNTCKQAIDLDTERRRSAMLNREVPKLSQHQRRVVEMYLSGMSRAEILARIGEAGEHNSRHRAVRNLHRIAKREGLVA